MSSSHWVKTSLGNLVQIKHGFAFKGEFFSNTPTRNILLTPGNFHIGGGFKYDKLKYYNGPIPEDYRLRVGDIVVTMTDLSRNGDTLGYSAIVPEIDDLLFLHNQRIGLLEFNDRARIDKNFIYWLLRTRDYQTFVVNSATGSTVKHTSPTRIREYEFRLPSLREQTAIAGILSALDEKIELNRQTNATLEAIAQAIFKEWFVYYNYPGATGNLVESELGLIPAGWQMGNLGEFIEVTDGRHDTPKKVAEGFPLITSKHLNKWTIDFDSAYLISEEDYIRRNEGRTVNKFDILISLIGTVGLLYFVMEDKNLYSIKNIGLLKSSQMPQISEYLYLFLDSNYGKNYLASRMAGTTQKYLTHASIREMPIILPPEQTTHVFRQLINPLFLKIQANVLQIQILAQIRDTLLPKLMRGEIEP